MWLQIETYNDKTPSGCKLKLHDAIQYGHCKPLAQLNESPIADAVEGDFPRWLVTLFAFTCGLAVANVYFAQPLLQSIASSFGVAVDAIGFVVTATQLGYAVGLLFLVPLGDLLDRRRLIIAMLLLSCVALAVVSLSPNLSLLLSAMVAIGLMAVVVQVLVAYTATLASAGQRGRAVGTVTSGVVFGILLARLLAGLLADLGGWRLVYLFSAGLMLLLTIVLIKLLPAQKSVIRGENYASLLASGAKLFITVPILRIKAILAMLIFMSFSLLWTSLVLPLSASPLFLSPGQIGLFGLAGVAGAVAAAGAGRRADKGRGEQTTGLALLLLVISWFPISLAGSSVLVLILGIVLLDFAVQAVHVTSQSQLFAARPDAQSRLVGAYMFFYSVGSGGGAIISTQVYARAGWSGVCATGAIVSFTALLFWFTTKHITVNQRAG